jgi:HSP20 family protein
MNMRDLIPWGRNAQTTPSPYREEGDPFMTLHREMNRLFDDVFRGFDIAPFGSFGGMGRMAGWPSIEVIETDKDVRVSAELPGLEEKDAEVEDKERAFSERTYGRFERRIPLGWDVEEDKVTALFRNGVLTVTMPKSAKAAAKAKRIAVTGRTKH